MLRRLSPLFLLVLLFALSGRLVHAQNPAPTPDRNPVKMSVDSPLAVPGSSSATTTQNMQVATQLGRWFPLAVLLSNTGDAVNGTLSLKLYADANGSASDRPVSTFVTTVDLPANQSNKRIWLYGRVEREDCTVGVVEFAGPGIQTRRAQFDLSDTASGTRTVLTVSDADERLSYLSSPTFRDPMLGLRETVNSGSPSNRFNNNPNLVRTLGSTHELVPTRWIGLDGVDCVVLHDFPHAALAPAQIDALRGYVSGGGTLVVFGGVNWQRIASSPLKELWPVVPTGSRIASATEANDLVQRYVTRSPLRGEDRLGGAPITMARGPLSAHARSLDGSPNDPTLAVKDYGAGRVVYLAYDPTNSPFSGWSGLLEMWKDIFGLSPSTPRLQAVTDSPDFGNGYQQGYYTNYGEQQTVTPTAQLANDLARTPQLKTPPVGTIALFLALYVFCLVPLNYCLLRFLDKREWAWITVPVVVAGFSVLAYTTALKIKGRDLLSRRVEIVRTSNGAPLGRADAMLWLFSPRKTSYDLSAADARYVIAPRIEGKDQSGSNVNILEPDESKAITVDGAAVNMWDYRTFFGATSLSLGKGISVTNGNGRGVQVTNGSDYALHGAVVVANGEVFALGDVAPGQNKAATQGESIDPDDPQLEGRIATASQIGTLFPTTNSEDPGAIARSALRTALGTNAGQRPVEGAMLVAWGTRDQPATTLKILNEAPLERSVTLFVVRAADLRNVTGSKVAALSLPASEPVSTGVGKPDRVRKTWDATLVASGPLNSLKITARGMRGGNTGYNSSNALSTLPAVRWELWNWQRRQWVTVTGDLQENRRQGYAYSNFSWKFEGALPNASEFVRQPDGRLRVRALTGDTTVSNISLSLQAR